MKELLVRGRLGCGVRERGFEPIFSYDRELLVRTLCRILAAIEELQRGRREDEAVN